MRTLVSYAFHDGTSLRIKDTTVSFDDGLKEEDVATVRDALSHLEGCSIAIIAITKLDS